MLRWGIVLSTVALLVGTARAADNSGSLEFSRIPASVRQQGEAGLYGTYDVFKTFGNPALIARQPRTWDAGLNAQYLFGDETLGSLGVGWAGKSVETGTYGISVMVAGYSAGAFNETDLAGNTVGSISPSGLRYGLNAGYQWQFLSFGAGVERASETFGVSGASRVALTPAALVVRGGTLVTVGRLDFGASYETRLQDVATPGTLGFGGSLRFTGWYKGAIAVDAGLPVGGDSTRAAYRVLGLGAGLVWNAHKMFDLRAGAVLPGGNAPMSIRGGFTVHYGNIALDYAILTGAAGLGMSHAIGTSWGFGGQREMPTNIFAQKEKAAGMSFEDKGRSLAVSNFEAQGVSASDAAIVSDMFRNEMVKGGSFDVVEKANMEKVLSEQAFQQTGCTTSECAVKLGKILNVQYLVVGSFGKLMDSYVLNIRVVKVENAKVIYSDTGQGVSTKEVTGLIGDLARRLTAAVTKGK
jgi:TolB-like protein